MTRAERMTAQLADLANTLRRDNPDHAAKVSVSDGVVWWREGATEYGIYASAIDGQIVRVYENGTSVIHRPIV